MTKSPVISPEIEALLRFYTGSKFISVKNIIEFSEYYCQVQEQLKGTMEESE